LRRFFAAWVVATVLACLVVGVRARLERPAPVPSALARWAIDALHSGLAGAAPPAAPKLAPDAASAAGMARRDPVIVLAWHRGRVVARHVGAGIEASVRGAVERFAAEPALARFLGSSPRASQLYFTVTRVSERAPWLRAVPMLAELSVVPLVEGVAVSFEDRTAYLTPDEITARGMWDSAVVTPIPDLSFGLSPKRVAERAAEQLGTSVDELLARGVFERFTCMTIARDAYPREAKVDRPALERAARESARFLLRHQAQNGRFTYRYDAGRGREMRGGYSLPRHAGTAYFLAQAARVLEMPEARAGALAALRFVREEAWHSCGDESRACVAFDQPPDMGAAALTALAAAEVLAGGDDSAARDMLARLTAFIRGMQRADGELMHVYDLHANKPVDVQRMYYSGEAAVALLASHRVLRDERDLKAVRPLMRHLTGAGWSFFGSRYFYGEEHWTCQAVAAAADRIEIGGALDFCLRWLGYQRALLYRAGETPWPVRGAIGVSPVIVPRLTSVASRVEAGAPIYAVARARGLPVGELSAQMEAHLSVLMRMRWAAGPTHLFRNPAAAFGGVPATQASLEVRNDFVQHAGSAMLAWAEILRRAEP
jgi:hypothetical protein